jgi:hypothetical protein
MKPGKRNDFFGEIQILFNNLYHNLDVINPWIKS